MSKGKIFPETKFKRADVLAAAGAVNVGCIVKDGKILPAINSATRLNRLAEKATAAWYSRLMGRNIVYTQNRLYSAPDALDSPIAVNFAATSPSFIETFLNKTPIAFVFGDTTYFRFSGLNYYANFNGSVVSCVLKNGRIFGVDSTQPHKIKWSGEGGVDDWTENISGAGWAYVNHGYGKILNLIVYRDKIVAVRECGLTFLSAYGTPENFKISYLERKLPKIYKNTVAVGDDRLIFYTADGLYSYDGNRVEKLEINLSEELQSPSFACCADGKYFLCGFSKSLQRKAVLVFDIIKNATYLIDLPANAVAAGDKVYAYTDTYEFRLGEGGGYEFTSGEINFSSDGYKVLKEVVIEGKGDMLLGVTNGVISRIVRGVRGKFRPNMRGKSFKITVCGSEKINGVSAVAEVKDEV